MSRIGLLRNVFTILERIAPTPGGNLAFRMWLTPPTGARGGSPASSRRDDRPGQGRVSTLMMPGERRLTVESWGLPDSDAVYLVHGWGGWRGQMGGYVQPLVDAGHRVVAFDAPAHGDSSPGHLGGKRTHMQEAADALTTVVATFGTATAVVAHSGGCTSTAAAVRDGLDVGAVVFVAPSADPVAVMHRIADALAAGPQIRRRMQAQAEDLAGRSLHDYDVTRLPQFSTVPDALIVHDDQDKEVPFSEGESIVKAWEGATWHPTSGLGHRRILRNDGVIQKVAEFIGDAARER